MKKLLSLLLLSPLLLIGQQRINSSFSFQSQNKLYSIYVPASYVAGTPIKLMLGLHPLNPARWNGQSWCDTLVDFAEANNLLLVCPDGGTDGRIDDPIDTAFTSALLDSMLIWYSVDTAKTYAMGFSWGGLTTYTYGLSHVNRFGGFIPIGAAINGSGPIISISSNAKDKAFYVVHGSQDSPNTRYQPLITELNNQGAILNSLLMSGVGHTIDFPNRNAILTTAFNWVDSVNCYQIDSIAQLSSSSYELNSTQLKLYPNPLSSGDMLYIKLPNSVSVDHEVNWISIDGSLVKSQRAHPSAGGELELDSQGLGKGQYLLEITTGEQNYQAKVIIR